jgi:sulfoxide reductase catalytic subunit YedY
MEREKMLFKKNPLFEKVIQGEDITDKGLYLRRREFIKGALVAGGAAALSVLSRPFPLFADDEENRIPGRIEESRYSTDEPETSYKEATTFNNFYEFGLGKRDPAVRSKQFKSRPWTVTVDGEVGRPGVMDVDELIRRFPLTERVYRMRCVEAWSMVIPWVGFPLADLISVCEPTSRAKYVAFTTLYDPEQMPGQKTPILKWPYVEGLRMDEAMNPLSILSVGMYGEFLPNQNGAPIRLVVPWKYGFKSIKSIVRISFTAEQPPTSWNELAPQEYGFYANVNPQVNHPRWSQRYEQRIGKPGRVPTKMYNGYGEYVAHLYEGMDLKVYY